jgi:hypothetical protein
MRENSKHLLLFLAVLLPTAFLNADSANRGCSSAGSCVLNASDSNCPSNEVHSHTFFMPRQVTFDQTFELAIANYDIYHPLDCDKECPWGIHFYATPFYQKSRKDECGLTRFFLPNGKCAIDLEQNGTGDVNPLFLQLSSPAATPFSSIFSIEPQRKSAGAVFNIRWDLGRYFDCWDGLWFSLNTAVLHVKHNLNVCEKPATQVTCPPFANACAAFNNPEWTAGRIPCCSKKHTGLDDIQVKLGYDWFACDCQGLDHLTFYLVGGIPTGKRPKSCFLFEPIVGSKHGSFGFGVNADNKIWAGCDSDITWMVDLKYRYVFKATERRSFDLCANGDWSRFLLLANVNDPITPIPAINVLTTKVKVTPRSTIDFWTALHYHYCNWGLEAGYNLWWRQAEKVRLDCTPDLAGLGIFDLAGARILQPTSASTANISQSIGGVNPVVSDATFVQLRTSDLNLKSAAHPKALSHKVYGAIDYRNCWCNYPLLIGFAGSYEFARPRRNAFEQWAVFGKLGITF